MNRSVWSRTGVGAAVAALVFLVGGGQTARAADDDLALKMSGAVNPGRFFVRAGGIFAKVKTKSGATYDVTGPLTTASELRKVFLEPLTPEQERAVLDSFVLPKTFVNASGNPITLSAAQIETARRAVLTNLQNGQYGVPAVLNAMEDDGLTSLGTPPGIGARADDRLNTAGISIGYAFGDEHQWVAEAFVLGKPLTVNSYATAGTVAYGDDPDNPQYRPLDINGRKIVTTKLLPPPVMFGKYWGGKSSKFRLFTGVVGMYAMFYDTKATDYLNTYVGGQSPGDTTVSIKNDFGLGPMLGLKYQFSDDWHLSLNVGHLKLKTQATLVTRNTLETSSSPVVRDLGYYFTGVMNAADAAYDPVNGVAQFSRPSRQIMAASGGAVGTAMRAVAAVRGQSSLGTYVRKTDLELTNTLFMLSIGRNF